MISTVRGEVLSAGLDHVVVEVGGVGLLLHTTPATAGGCRDGAAVQLWTTLVVREESLTLYGFDDPDARALFEQVQTVSGVGPRLALAMLSVHAPEQVRRAISGGDLVALTKVPGIGRKGAERIVLELRDKVHVVATVGSGAPSAAPGASDDPAGDQVREALVGLGWNAKQAEQAVAAVRRADDPPAEISALLRAALRELGR